MSSRKIRYRKSDGTIATEKFSFNKNKKYKFNKSTGAVEEFTGTPAEDEITIPGSKSSLRRLAEAERNISILASKSGVSGQSNADTDVLLKTGKAADSDKLDGLDSSAFQAAGDYVGGGEYHNFGNISIGSSVTTTALLIADLTSKGFFSRSHSVGKCSWSYAGNGDLTDTGFGTFELAGCVVETFVEGVNKTVRITRPNTGGDGPSVLVYNDQANGTYSPGWREMVTSYGGNTNITGNLTATGDITAYSDDTLKENVQTIDGALERVEAVRGVTFDRIDDGSTSVGVIAQELEAVLPEAVKTDANGIRHVAYGNITGLLIEAVKELSAEIKELKK